MDKYLGLPFEARCAFAIEMLRDCRSDFEKMRNDHLFQLQDLKKKYQPEPGDSEEVKKMIEEWVAQDTASLTTTSEKILATGWQTMEKLCRTLYGDDATDFALVAVDKEKGEAAN